MPIQAFPSKFLGKPSAPQDIPYIRDLRSKAVRSRYRNPPLIILPVKMHCTFPLVPFCHHLQPTPYPTACCLVATNDLCPFPGPCPGFGSPQRRGLSPVLPLLVAECFEAARALCLCLSLDIGCNFRVLLSIHSTLGHGPSRLLFSSTPLTTLLSDPPAPSLGSSCFAGPNVPPAPLAYL